MSIHCKQVFTFGFPLRNEDPRDSHHASNWFSAAANRVDIKLSEELETQETASLFTLPRFSGFRISPVGSVPNKVVGEFRLIHNLSYLRRLLRLTMASPLIPPVFPMVPSKVLDDLSNLSTQEPIRWSLQLPYKPLESTLYRVDL